MDLDSVIARLSAVPNRQAVADATGLRYMYLYKLCKGRIKRPGQDKIDTLRRYFEKGGK